MIRLYADALRMAIYEEASGGGDPINPNSQMNRPVVNPNGWLNNIYFHSNFDYYSTRFFQTTTISHAAVAGRTTAIGAINSFAGQSTTANHLLVQHNLGVVPKFFLVYNGRMIPHGTPIQRPAEGRARFVSGYATTSQIRLFERAFSSATALPAVSYNYQTMVFSPSVADPLLDQLLISPANVVFGQGKFRMEWPHLRVVGSGESPFAQALGRSAAIGNGAIRVWPPNSNSPIDFGGTYEGNFTSGPSFVNLRAGV